MLVIAYLISPAAVRLLGNTSEKVSAEEAKSSRGFAVVAVAISAGVGFAAQHAGQSLIDSPPHLHGLAIRVVELLGSLLSAVPYILLFIALSLIAAKFLETVEEPIVDGQ